MFTLGEGGRGVCRDISSLRVIRSRTHPDSHVDVLGVDLRPQVLADLLLAEELLEELGAVFQVVAADPPLPRFPVLDAGGVVARAPLHPARAARFGERVGQRRRGHGQQEGRLLERWDGGLKCTSGSI